MSWLVVVKWSRSSEMSLVDPRSVMAKSPNAKDCVAAVLY